MATRQLSVRIPEDLHAWVREAADRELRTTAQEIVWLLEWARRNYPGETPGAPPQAP